MDDNEYIAKRIKAIRIRKGLSQVEFARRLGTTKPIISAFESCKVICDDDFLDHICEVFNVKSSWFYLK